MESQVVDSFSKFIESTEFFGILKVSLPFIFRGQPVKGNLVPNIVRKNNSFEILEIEKKMIEQFELMGTTFLPEKCRTRLDILVLAQHFRLKTRLLDWTSNPLAALWFACADKSSGDVYVYGLEANDLLVKNVYEEDPFSYFETLVFQPRLNNPRIIAQHGWFTLHGFSVGAKKFVPLENDPEVKDHLNEYVIPEAKREEFLWYLDHYGISFRTLYPDLEGLCLYLNWRHEL